MAVDASSSEASLAVTQRSMHSFIGMGGRMLRQGIPIGDHRRMYCNGIPTTIPEVITLSDSDDEEVQKATTSSATASVSILHERPLSPSAFLFPPQQEAPFFSTANIINSSTTSSCTHNMNRMTVRSSRLHSSKRLAQDHQDVVVAKRFGTADHSQRRPLQQSTQIVPTTSFAVVQDTVAATPSTSNSQPRQQSVQNDVINAQLNGNSSTPTPIRVHSAVPYSQQNTCPSSQQRHKTTEPPQRQAARQTQHQRISDPPTGQRQEVLASPQVVSRQLPTAQRRNGPVNSMSNWRPVTQRTRTLNTYCYESFDPKAPPFEPQTFSAKFKCCYGRCRKILSNNVSLMFHLWTHLVCERPCEAEGDTSMSHLEMERMCPQCLYIFPTSHEMQLHYNNVHGDQPSETTCNICELTVDPRLHMSVHGDDDAPYHCRKCRYRTSIRTHLLDHFVRFHSNTRSLLCPFCLLSFNVASNPSNSSVVTCGHFVNHMRQHRTTKNIRCWCCALKFVRQSDRKTHKRDHTKKNPKWISKPYTKHQRRKGRKLWPSSNSHRCLECAEVVDDLQEHTRQIRTCARCDFSTACDDEYMHHKGVQCNIRRIGFTRSRLLRCCVACSQCGRQSADAESIFPHIASCSEGRALIYDASYEPVDEVAAAHEQQEIEHFALRERDLLEDKDWLPVAAKVAQQQSVPNSIRKIHEMLNGVNDDDPFLNISKKKLACFGEEILTEELDDVLSCMEDLIPGGSKPL